MTREELSKRIKEIAPNFVSKFKMEPSLYGRYSEKKFHFANEIGGIGDYEIEYGQNDHRMNNAEIFYKLAKNLENVTVEENYNPLQEKEEHRAIGEIPQFHTQLDYRWLNPDDIYRYFSWRDAVKRVFENGAEDQENSDIKYLEKTSNDIYLMLYVFEVINLVGIESIEQGYQILLNKLRDLFSNIDRIYIYRYIIREYAINYGIRDLTEGVSYISPDVIKLKEGKYLELRTYFKNNSAYKYLESSFFSTDKGYLIFEILPYVCAGIRKHMEQKQIDFSVLLAGSFFTDSSWRPFSDYNYFQRGCECPICKFIPDLRESYSYKNGNWARHTWFDSKYTEGIIGYMIKITEKNLRQYYHMNSRITVNLDRMHKNELPTYNSLYEKYRDELYSEDCQTLITNIVKTYILKKAANG